MKLSLKRLGILTIIAFLFSPIISPIPGVLLIISMGFIWLSKQINPAEINKEIQDKTEVINRGDHIIIIERKVIKKEDLTFDELRKYNLKNVNCINICGAFEAHKTKNHLDEGHKHCLICKKWLITDEINCICCSSKLRIKTEPNS